ncbi:MAG: hypothetical protein AAGE86_13240 [Pseudomonadota bacterium]
MGFWTAAVIIVAIWALVTVWSRRHDREMGVTRDEDGNPVFPPAQPLDHDEMQREIAQLRERIQVLERIATDNNTLDARERARIAAEIEALRGPDEGPTTTKQSPDASRSKEDLSE